jgi:serine/threonine protein kinase
MRSLLIYHICILLKAFFQPSGHSDSTDNDDKGSLPYMAPEIFEKRCKQKHAFLTPTANTPVATTPICATPTRMTAGTFQPASTPSTTLLKEQAIKSNMHRDMWAFGCVLYELATHRRPWYHKMPSASTSFKSSGTESHCTDSKLPHTPGDLHLFFLRTFWRKLGKFHGGWFFSKLFLLPALLVLTESSGCLEGDDALELRFPKNRRIPPCLLEAIRLCTQKDLDRRPHDIQIIINELEKFSSIGSKRSRD